MHLQQTKKDYTPMPTKIVTDIISGTLKTKDIVTYFFSTSNKSDFPISLRTLADQTGMSRVLIRESLERLRTAGYLTWETKVRKEPVRIGDRMCLVSVKRMCFSRVMNFRKSAVEHRKIQNAWKYLISSPEQLAEVLGVKTNLSLSATELAMLIFLRIMRFESDVAGKAEESLVYNIADISKAIGLSRATLKKSVDALAALRIVRVDPETHVVQLKDSRIKYIAEQLELQEIQIRREKPKLNTDEFGVVDQRILREAIAQAPSKSYLRSVRSYLVELVTNGFIDQNMLEQFGGLCDQAEDQLKVCGETPKPDQVFVGDTVFPIWIETRNG